VLATEQDIEAIDWIKGNTPSDARFMINVEPWQYRIYRGSDGGWWIPLLSNRDTILPPVFYGWGEREYIHSVENLADRVHNLQGCNQELWDLIEEYNITHIYIGVKGGTLKAIWFEYCPGIQRIYHQGGVSIYKVCEAEEIGNLKQK
jgi:uncharacterized membrane protein